MTGDERQNKLFKEFLSRNADKKDVKLFDEAFDAIIRRQNAETTHNEASSKAYRSRVRKRIRFYENKIAPAAKLSAIERNNDLVLFLFRYLRRYGFPANTSHLLRRMEEKRLLDVENPKGEVRTLNHRTVRLMIEDMRRPFSWPKPGRRRAKTQRKSVAQLRQELGRSRPRGVDAIPDGEVRHERVQPSLPKLKFLEALPKPAQEAPELPSRGRRRPER